MDGISNPNPLAVLEQQVPDAPENTFIVDALSNSEAKIIIEEGGLSIIRTPESTLYEQGGNILLQRDKDPEELAGLVVSEDGFLNLLFDVSGWTCCSVGQIQARSLGVKIGKRLEREIKYHPCQTYTCSFLPAYSLQNPDSVRLATLDDLGKIKEAAIQDSDLASFTAYRLETFIKQELLAIATRRDEVVAIVSAEAITPKYIKIMYYTKTVHRGQGLASDGHYLVLKSILGIGKTAVTSISDSNPASIRASTRFGYKPVSKQSYFIIGDPPYQNKS